MARTTGSGELSPRKPWPVVLGSLESREEPIYRSIDSTVMVHAGYFRVGQ